MTTEISALPIYHIHYGTTVNSVNDAVVSADSPEKAKSLLEDYLLKHPLNSQFPEATVPDNRGLKCNQLEFTADKSGVIYCSLDFQRATDGAEPEFRTLDREALSHLGQPMRDWRFKPTAFDD